MPRAREVRDTFRNIISANQQTQQEIKTTLSDIQSKKAQANRTYQDNLASFLNTTVKSTDPATLTRLSTALGDTIDYAVFYEDTKKRSEDAANELDEQIKTQGTPAQVREDIARIERDIQTLHTTQEKNGLSLKKINKNLEETDAFNDRYKGTKPLLAEGSIEYFSSKSGFSHAWHWMTDGHYRQGRRIISNMQKHANTDPVHSQAQRESTREGSSRLNQDIQDQTSILNHRKFTLTQMTRTAQAVMTEEEIIGSLRKRVLDKLENRTAFGNVVKAFADLFPADIVERRAKMESYNKVAQALELRHNTIGQASAKLEAPMSKLNRAVSAGSSKNININLADIQQKFSALNTQTRQHAKDIKNVGTQIDRYRIQPQVTQPAVYSSTYNPLDLYVNFMIFDMLTHHDCDAGILQHTLGTPDMSALNNAHVFDTPSLSVDPSTSFLQDTFNTLSGSDMNIPDLNTPSFDMPNIDVANVDVPAFEVPSFDIPSFEIPSIDIPSIDIPSIDIPSIDIGGSFDSFSGGGFDF